MLDLRSQDLGDGSRVGRMAIADHPLRHLCPTRLLGGFEKGLGGDQVPLLAQPSIA